MGEDFPMPIRAPHVGDDDDALPTEFVRRGVYQVWIMDGGGLDRDLVRAGEEEGAHIFYTADAATDRKRRETAISGTFDDIDQDVALLMAGRDVEKTDFVGALLIIERGLLHGIASVTQIDEVHAFDDAPVLHI